MFRGHCCCEHASLSSLQTCNQTSWLPSLPLRHITEPIKLTSAKVSSNDFKPVRSFSTGSCESKGVSQGEREDEECRISSSSTPSAPSASSSSPSSFPLFCLVPVLSRCQVLPLIATPSVHSFWPFAMPMYLLKDIPRRQRVSPVRAGKRISRGQTRAGLVQARLESWQVGSEQRSSLWQGVLARSGQSKES